MTISPVALLAQSSSESPYSDQNFDPANSSWSDNPVLWMGLVVIIALLAVMIMKLRQKPGNEQ